jgi:hypothetical protein
MERASKRQRSLSTEYDDSEGNDDWIVANRETRPPEPKHKKRYVAK